MSRYRLTVLTPTLVGDGNKLAPIDYMVWKDQVNVLDQRRIFKLLAKGSRLDSYLAQVRKVEKLDFTSWGGYAQNYALRRIALEDSSVAEVHQRERAENLFIPTFAGAETQSPFLPGTALKGPLRTAYAGSRLREESLKHLSERSPEERPLRRPGHALEHAALGEGAQDRTRSLALADGTLTQSAAPTKVYLLRTSTLLDRGKNGLEPGWKTSPRGAVDARRIQDSTPQLAEMAAPGTEFQGAWSVPVALRQSGTLRLMRWKEAPGPDVCRGGKSGRATPACPAKKLCSAGRPERRGAHRGRSPPQTG